MSGKTKRTTASVGYAASQYASQHASPYNLSTNYLSRPPVDIESNNLQSNQASASNMYLASISQSASPIIHPITPPADDRARNAADIEPDVHCNPCGRCASLCSRSRQLCVSAYNSSYCISISILLSLVAIIMICSMVPMSFYGVEYNEYAIHRDKLFNKVDYSAVYENGNYFLGLNQEMIKFPRTFTYEQFTDNALRVFSKEGLEFSFQCSFQWRPIKASIPEIHRQFRLSYRPQVLNRVIATIKNTVTQYTTDDFVHSRAAIDQTITNNIGAAVRDLGFDIPNDKFQFAKPLLPDNVKSRFLQTQVQLVKNDEQTLRQQQAMVLQETNVLVGNINSNATKLLTQAASTATRIIAEASATAFNVINTAEQHGLYLLFTSMNITDDYTKSLLRKIIAVENNPSTKLYFGATPTSTLSI